MNLWGSNKVHMMYSCLLLLVPWCWRQFMRVLFQFQSSGKLTGLQVSREGRDWKPYSEAKRGVGNASIKSHGVR